MLLNAFSILLNTGEKEVLLIQKLQWKTVLTMCFFPKCNHASCSSTNLGVMPRALHHSLEWSLLWSVAVPYEMLFMCVLTPICWLEQQNTFLLLLSAACPKTEELCPLLCVTKNTDCKDSLEYPGKAFLKVSEVHEEFTFILQEFYWYRKSQEGGNPGQLPDPWYVFGITS